jgi:putative glutamine amidotransferase
MKFSPLKKILLSLAILLLLPITILSQAQSPDRFFDTAQPNAKEVRLTVFSPSRGRVKTLVVLKENGFLDIKNLTVVAVYHKNASTNLQDIRKYLEEKNVEWIKFHQVNAEIDQGDIFKKNDCSVEFETIFKKSDGVLFFGGPDIPPSLFRNKTNFLTVIEDPYRHYFELSAIFHFLGGLQDESFRGLIESNPDFPILAICLGCQSLNVATGGTLIQDIWSETYGLKYLEDVISLGPDNWHTNPFERLYPEEKLYEDTLHPIRLEEKGKFCALMGFKSSDHPYILSAHHQQVGKMGKGFKIAATSLDGKVVEAIEHSKFPNVLGVQFHPEATKLWKTEDKVRFTPQDKESISLRSILENHPPSVEFHRKLWSWFCQKLKENYNNKIKAFDSSFLLW